MLPECPVLLFSSEPPMCSSSQRGRSDGVRVGWSGVGSKATRAGNDQRMEIAVLHLTPTLIYMATFCPTLQLILRLDSRKDSLLEVSCLLKKVEVFIYLWVWGWGWDGRGTHGMCHFYNVFWQVSIPNGPEDDAESCGLDVLKIKTFGLSSL